MPKKSKQKKQAEARVQRKLRKKFVKAKIHKRLSERVETLEREIAELKKLLSDRAAPVSDTDQDQDQDQNQDQDQDGEVLSKGDDLQRIKGIGAVLEKKLHGIGINSFKQIANWDQADIDNFSHQLSFKGRIERESWVAQAIALSSD